MEVEQSIFSKKESLTLTAQQVEQQLKLLPQSASSSCNTGTTFSLETDEEICSNFVGNVPLLSAIYHKHDWILDTGATYHIAMDISLFTELRRPSSNCYVSFVKCSYY